MASSFSSALPPEAAGLVPPRATANVIGKDGKTQGVEIGKDAQDGGGPASDVFTESDVTSRV